MTIYLLVQISYLGICNNRHNIEQRFSRWLLMVQDRIRTSELKFTQDAIAGILGIRHATILWRLRLFRMQGSSATHPASSGSSRGVNFGNLPVLVTK